MWVRNVDFWPKDIRQRSHPYGLCFSWTCLVCLFKLLFLVKRAPQSGQHISFFTGERFGATNEELTSLDGDVTAPSKNFLRLPFSKGGLTVTSVSLVTNASCEIGGTELCRRRNILKPWESMSASSEAKVATMALIAFTYSEEHGSRSNRNDEGTRSRRLPFVTRRPFSSRNAQQTSVERPCFRCLG